MDMRWIAAVIVVLLASIGCGEETGPEGGEERLYVDDFQYAEMPTGERIITGTVFNDTGDRVDNAQIQVSLFDEENRRVGTMSVSVGDLVPGDSVTFREPVDAGDEVVGARVRSIVVL